MAPAPVLLGLAGDLVGEADAVDYSATRIGGHPVFPGSSPPADCCSRLVCSVCGRRLSLVLQAYAPHPAASERVLMLFGCTALGCGKSASCWAALRCQLQPQQQQQQQHQGAAKQQQPLEATRPVAEAAAPAAAGFDAPGLDDWGLTGMDDWGQAADAAADAPAAAAAAAFDFSALTSSLEAAGQQQQAAAAAAAPGSKHKAGKQGDAAEMQQLESCRGSAGPPLPEFYLYAAAEPDGAASKAISSKELAHVQQLLAAYQVEASGAASASTSATEHGSSSSSNSSSGRQQPPLAAAVAAAAGADGEVGEGSWGGEEYEADAVRGVESAYLKYSKRLARQPDQCARYSLGGPLLWPKQQQPQPSRCPRCGGARVFELQLMPPLIQLAIEAAQMMLELQQQPDAAVVDAVANWDWVTVAVFTCEASCSSSSSGGGGAAAAAASGSGAACEFWVEELQLINEADCHTALPAPLPAAAAAAASPAVAAAPAAGGAVAGGDGEQGGSDAAIDDDDNDAFDEDESSV